VNSGWQILPFSDVVTDESGGNEKTPQSEFLSLGRFAVVDQGKELIAGYVDDESRVCRAGLPVVVFGDHTRCFKYVDFPFCMGADGVKVLRPKIDADTKYLYHYLRQIRLTDGGYDRHFKYLKRIEVVLPPLPEQRRIAEVLDRAEALRAKRRAALAQLDTLTQSIFLDLFGDPATNPKGWPISGIERVCELIVDCVNRTAPVTNEPTAFKMIRTSNVKNGRVNLADVKYVTKETFDRWNRRATPQPGDVLLTREAPVGEAGMLDTDDTVFLGQRLMLYRANPNYITPTFLLFSFLGKFLQNQFDKHGSGSTVKHLPLPVCRSFRMLVPPISLQREFARRIAAVDKLKSAHRASLAKLDALFASLQHRAFRGEL
jgi:type I restriction enzyme S subunit